VTIRRTTGGSRSSPSAKGGTTTITRIRCRHVTASPWYELDLNWIGISTLRRLGLAWDIKVAKVAQTTLTEETVVGAEEAVA
jgi:hypothetical protein